MKKALLIIILILGLIQFIRPEKNISNDFSKDISTVVSIPEDVQLILKNACADCHSNATKYPWYSQIAPVSWYIAQHVNEGKEHMNLSNWTNYNEHQKEHILKDFEEVLESHEMPLKSYVIIHKEAELSQEQNEALLNWVRSIQ